MSYTKAFQHLLRLSDRIDLKQDIQYKRVAVFIGRVFMSEAEHCHTEGKGEYLDMPITKRMGWVEQLYGYKEPMLGLIIHINDYEWKLIQKAMTDYAAQSKGSAIWIERRHGWITQLDTLRAFN